MSELRRPADRGAQLQPDVQDLHGSGRRDRVGGLPAAGDGAGNFLELREYRGYTAGEAAVRRRAAGQIVSQRDHDREFYLPHARVRADGDGVLRAARYGGRREVV